MPGQVETKSASRKRKRTVDGRVVLKKPTREATSQILLLEQQILNSRRNYNNLLTLIELARWSGPANNQQHHAVVALCRVFCRLMATGHLIKTRNIPENEAVVIQWLGERLQTFHDLLLDILLQGDYEQQCTALVLSMQLIKEEATYMELKEDSFWMKGLFYGVLQGLILHKVSDQIRRDFVKNFVDRYDDIRFYTFKILPAVISSTDGSDALDNVILILLAIEYAPDSEEDSFRCYVDSPNRIKDLSTRRSPKKQAQEAWMTVFNQNLSKAQWKRLLNVMTHQIAPWFHKTELLMDLLVESFDIGGSESLLALSGLFYLIQKKNLDYPRFYEKVYSLLGPGILHSKHLFPFLSLLDTFLASSHLPAALVASFVKRLSRLCLHSPPSGIVAVVPWIYNLLKSHPTCTFMIHRELPKDNSETQDGDWTIVDPFQMDSCDPMQTKAEYSSIWEMQSLQFHCHPNVATIAKIMSEQFTKQSYDLKDFFDHSYGSMLSNELAKDVKKTPIVEHNISKGMFMDLDIQPSGDNSLVTDLWGFDS